MNGGDAKREAGLRVNPRTNPGIDAGRSRGVYPFADATPP